MEDLRGGEPAYNASRMRAFLAGEDVPFRSTALLNAASAIVADGRGLSDPEASLSDRFSQAYALAEEAVDSSRAARLLDRWIAAARR